MRRDAKRDGNEDEIMSVFLAAGFSAEKISGAGVPDLLLGINGINVLVEVKAPKQGRFTPAQKKWHSKWQGRAHVVETIEQAQLLIDLYRRARAA